MPTKDPRLEVLSKLSMFEEGSERNETLDEASRPSQKTQREDVTEAARPIGGEVEAEEEDPRSPCVRTREKAIKYALLCGEAKAMMGLMVETIGRAARDRLQLTSEIVDVFRDQLDDWEERKIDLES